MAVNEQFNGTIRNPICECCRTERGQSINIMDAGAIIVGRRDGQFPIYVCSVECERTLKKKFNM